MNYSESQLKVNCMRMSSTIDFFCKSQHHAAKEMISRMDKLTCCQLVEAFLVASSFLVEVGGFPFQGSRSADIKKIKKIVIEAKKT